MRKIVKMIGICTLLLALIWVGTVIADRRKLNEGLIRLHVVAASDSREDQAVKLRIRDAVMAALQGDIVTSADAEEAKAYLQTRLADLKIIADDILKDAGMEETAAVTLEKECFPTREYDTFSLPAGVYESLKITVGPGEGQNWWCVVFPSLCLPATTEGFADTAVGSGFPDSLAGALQQDGGYEIRFFLLDCLGWLEILFHT